MIFLEYLVLSPMPGFAFLGLLCGIAVVCLIGFECWARMRGHEPFGQRSVNSYFWVQSSILGFRNRANGKFYNRSISGSPLVTTDSQGYRNGFAWEAGYKGPIIAFVGDSTTFCAEVGDKDTIPSQVAKVLTLEFPALRVLNAGVRGYGTLQSKRMLQEILARFLEVRIVVYICSENDFVENVNPITHYPARAPYVAWNDAGTATREIEVGELKEGEQVYKKTLGPAFSRNPLLWTLNWARTHCAFLRLLPRLARYFILKPPAQAFPGGITGPVFTEQAWEYQKKFAHTQRATQVMDHLVTQMYDICRSAGVSFLATTFASQADDRAVLLTRCQALRIPFVDARPYFDKDRTWYYSQRKMGWFDPHHGVRGTETFARAITPALQRLLRQSGEMVHWRHASRGLPSLNKAGEGRSPTGRSPYSDESA